ncbi:MAG: DUF2252 domain-containing protein [Baekduiaceae bacterium]
MPTPRKTTTTRKPAARKAPARRRKPAAPVVEHLTVAERAAKGKEARANVPRRSHGLWAPAADRFDPVALLEEQAATRVPELVPLRYGRMLASPFTFYRGAAYLMAADLAGEARSGLITQLCGDAHLSNFGVYAAPDRQLVFDLNDFDETLPGPFEWDVKRLVASFAVAGRDRGLTAKQRERVNLQVGLAYRETIRELAGMRTLDLWYLRVDVEEIMAQVRAQASAKALARAEKNVAKTRAKDSLRALAKLTEVVDGEPRIRNDAPRIIRIHDLAPPELREAVAEQMHAVLRDYRATLTNDRRMLLERFRFVDAARKVVGVGSVGTRAWIALMLGRDDSDPLFLQLKEAQPSVLEPFLGESTFATHGERVVQGQRLMQAASDIMLGWLTTDGLDGVTRHYYVRQLWDAKGSALIDQMEEEGLTGYARICGSTLARAHARAGDGVAIASYLGKSDTFDRAMATFAEAYADQNERDYETVSQAVRDGRLHAEFEPRYITRLFLSNDV